MTINYAINAIGNIFPGFYISKVRGLERITFNNVNHVIIWQCRKKHG
jgi:hypothetical protein